MSSKNPKNIHILYLIQFFGHPEESWAANRSYEFVRSWAERGVKITVITGWSHLTTRSPKDDIHPNITVVRIGTHYTSSLSPLSRVMRFITFAIRALTIATFQIRKPDIIYASSTPLTVPLIGVLLKKWHDIPLIAEFRDLWPDFPIEILNIKSAALIHFLHTVESYIYTNANTIVVLNYRTSDVVNIRVGYQTPVWVYPNGSSIDYLKKAAVKQKPGKHILYAGSLGKANNVKWLIGLFKTILNDERLSDSEISVYGSGNDEMILASFIRSASSKRIHWYRPVSRNKMNDIYQQAHISIVSFLELESLLHNSPNKWFDSLSTATPIISNIDFSIPDTNSEMTFGLSSFNYDKIIEFIISLKQPERYTSYSKNALTLAKLFNRDKISLEIFNRIISLI